MRVICPPSFRVLVVTPTLGVSPWLDQTMTSVRAQSLTLQHVLVAPGEAEAALAARFPWATVVAEPPGGRGMYAAINAGVAAAGDWDGFTYLNDDDELCPGFDRAARRAARMGSRPAIIYGGVQLIGPRGQRLGAIPLSPAPALNRALYAQRLEPVYQHGTIVTRAAWDRLGGFDETLRYCGDSEFLARACVLGLPFVRLPGAAVAAFRLRGGQLTKNRAALVAERRQVDRKLGLVATRRGPAHAWARLVFRAANLPVYVERVARHGPLSFDELLTRVG